MGYETTVLLALTLSSLLSIANAIPKICSVIQDEKAALWVVDGDYKPMVAQATFVDDKFNSTGYVSVYKDSSGLNFFVLTIHQSGCIVFRFVTLSLLMP